MAITVLCAALALSSAAPAEAQDTTRPTITSATVVDTYLVEVTFDEWMNRAHQPWDTMKVKVGGLDHPVRTALFKCRAATTDSCRGNSKWLWLTLFQPIYSTDTVTLDYAPGDSDNRVLDLAGNELSTFAGRAVTNSSTAGKPSFTLTGVTEGERVHQLMYFNLVGSTNGAVWPGAEKIITANAGKHTMVTRYSGPLVTVSFELAGAGLTSTSSYELSHWTGEENYRTGTTWRLPHLIPDDAFGDGPMNVTIEPGTQYSVGSPSTGCTRLYNHSGNGGEACSSTQTTATPLTAQFDELPTTHDTTAFDFEIEFSEAVSLTSAQMISALSVTNGTATSAALESGSDNVWEITVAPTGQSSVTVSLSPPDACTDTGAVCTSSNRKLSNAIAAQVGFAAHLSVADASATEGTDDNLDFVVTLFPALSSTVTVDYATSDIGGAQAGLDYTATSSTLTFTAGQTTKTISVPIIDDDIEDDDETLRLTLSNPSGATLKDATATGTIHNTETTTTTTTPAALTASFSGVPESHDGESAFTFTVAFSENVDGLGYAAVRDAFDIDEGSVARASRATAGQNQSWTIEIEPDGNETVTITLPAGSISAGDRSLSAAVSATVAGPPTTTTTTPAALTASFSGVPESHDGESTFTFTLALSENIDSLSYETVRDAFDVDEGSVARASRATAGQNRSWTIAVEPDGSDAVTITLPSGSISSGDRSLSAAVSATVAGPPPAALTASFSDVPSSHGGSNTSFTFDLAFSEDVAGLGYATVRDAFTVTNGSVTRARRKTAGENRNWEITAEPAGNTAVSITLPAAAITTNDNRSLQSAVSATVSGPIGISVADAEVEEGDGAVLTFTVSLSRAAAAAMSVAYATSDGTAQAGSDYTAASSTLSFAAGDSSKNIEVSVLDDSHNEGDETLTLTLSNPSAGVLTDGTARGTIKNHDAMPMALVARFGRTAAVHVVEQVEERVDAPRGPGFEGRFAGRELRRGGERDFALGFLNQLSGIGGGGTAMHGPLSAGGAGASVQVGMAPTSAGGPQAATAPGGMSDPRGSREGAGLFQSAFGGGDLLSGSAFALSRETRDGGILSFWSRNARSHFSGQDGNLALGGRVRTTMFGADYAKGPLVTGLSMAHSRGLGEYAGPAGGQVASAVTGLYPWLGYKATERITVWGVAGYGAGSMLLTPEGAGALDSALSMAMAAAGTRGELVAGRGAGGFELAFKADALWVGTSIDGVDGPTGRLRAARAGVTRIRTALEGSRAYRPARRVSLMPSIELGLRHDGGDAETGVGMDVGAGLVVSDAASGLAVDVRVRTLLVHQAKGFRERGMAISVSYDPTPSTPLGFTARVAPAWGGQAASGADALWGRETMTGMSHGGVAEGNRLDGEVGHGLPVGTRLVGTPRMGFSTSEYGRSYRVGYGLGMLERESLSLEQSVDAERRESALLNRSDRGIIGRATVGW